VKKKYFAKDGRPLSVDFADEISVYFSGSSEDSLKPDCCMVIAAPVEAQKVYEHLDEHDYTVTYSLKTANLQKGKTYPFIFGAQDDGTVFDVAVVCELDIHFGNEGYYAQTDFVQDNWRWCNKCQGLFFAGDNTPGARPSCPAGGMHDQAGSTNYSIAANGDIKPTAKSLVQHNWRWCSKCEGLYFVKNNGVSFGVCPRDGGQHKFAFSANYVITFINPNSLPGQDNWRWCNKCQGLFFAGNHTPGSCPAGGMHDQAGSGNYIMARAPGVGQDNWRWCNKCQGLFFAGHDQGVCPKGGSHDMAGSGNYRIATDLAPGSGQDNWRYCNKCQGLFFAGHDQGVCPKGGSHDMAGSGNYGLTFIDPNSLPGQDNWRWCNKCQGLFFAGNHSPGVCPKDKGIHDQAGSGDYIMKVG